ncbi:MAG TPA: hypothetical protein VGL99_24165, partial [Chloroflexota bacterium]
MIARARHQARLPLAAIAALALLAFSLFTSIRPSIGATDVRVNSTPPPAAVTVAQRPAATDSGPCNGAYVTGDIVGEA